MRRPASSARAAASAAVAAAAARVGLRARTARARRSVLMAGPARSESNALELRPDVGSADHAGANDQAPVASAMVTTMRTGEAMMPPPPIGRTALEERGTNVAGRHASA